jgi:hypothetical protein
MQKAKEIALKIGKTDDSALQSAENELSRIKSLNE